MDLPGILQIILYGLLKGSVYGIIGLGMALLGGVARLINVAHGWFVILGAYITYWLFKIYNLDPMLSIPLIFFNDGDWRYLLLHPAPSL